MFVIIVLSLVELQTKKTFPLFHCCDLGKATSSYVASVFRISSSTLVALAYVLNVLARPMLTSSEMSVCNFRTTHHFLSCCTLVCYHYVNPDQLAVKLVEENVTPITAKSHYNLLLLTRFPIPLLFQVSFFP